MRDTLKNTSETLNGKIDTLGETNKLIAKNILKATKMQIESSQNSNNALQKVGQELSTELRDLKESLDSRLGSIHSAIMAVEEEIDDGNGNTEVQKSLENIASNIELLNSDGFENLKAGLANVEDEIRKAFINCFLKV